jgi:UDP-N-acetylglucosamine--N-acetylmuramyl-(pentapeptide) pyrophosphoryl-undecaprenol N-acetylglucosamine transferase
MHAPQTKPLIAIACGGTGGHLFPGMAIAEALQIAGCDVMLLVSPKEVDQQAVRAIRGMRVETLPAVGLSRGGALKFAAGFFRSLRMARRLFRESRPRAVLAMGGFTSAPPVLAGKFLGAKTFLHEANAIPGRANRWLAHVVNEAFVGFAGATDHLFIQRATTTGTPVRSQFQPMAAAGCRAALGLAPNRPVLLVVGGSQGASGINDLVLAAQPPLPKEAPDLQFVHLTGAEDFEKFRAVWEKSGQRAVVRPFLTEMEIALGAATIAVSRAGASSLAEFAAVRVPAILVPYPAAVDNHQFFNAMSLVRTGAALMLEQRGATGEQLARLCLDLLRDDAARARMCDALHAWDFPAAAETIARRIIEAIGCATQPSHAGQRTTGGSISASHFQVVAS